MAILHIRQIVSILEKEYISYLDYPDTDDGVHLDYNKNIDKDKGISRALSAFAISNITGCSIEQATSCIVDGAMDNGIDAIYYDSNSNCLFLCQGKYIKDGKKEPSSGDIRKFLAGCNDLLNLKFEKFNSRVQKRSDEIEAIITQESEISFKLLIVYTGINNNSSNENILSDYAKEMNDINDWLSYEFITEDKLYKMLINNGKSSINTSIVLHDFGYYNEIAKSAYGKVLLRDIGNLWLEYGVNLFAENIRAGLKKSDVNDGMLETLKNESVLFWYYNNGITIICDSMEKTKEGGNSRKYGCFSLKNISVVNGAQTVSTIGKYYLSLPEQERDSKLENTFVQVRLIEVLDQNGKEVSPGLGKKVTINNNMQNRIIARDFESQKDIQKRFKQELQMEGITYHIARSEDEIKDENNFTISEAGRARCNSIDIKRSLIAHRGLNSYLFIKDDSDDYRAVFNDSVTGIELWNTVKIQRIIDKKINDIKKEYKIKGIEGEKIITYAKDCISLCVFKALFNTISDDRIMEIENLIIDNYIDIIVPQIISEVMIINKPYINVFKNSDDVEKIINKVKELKQ